MPAALVDAPPAYVPPPSGPAEERARFRELQARLPALFRDVFPDRLAPRTVVVVPSLSLDGDVLAAVSGAHHYEERMLCLLLLLRLPRTRVVFLSSQPIDPQIIDYYLQLLPGVPFHHARRRLVLLACRDASPRPLSAKILDRPRLLRRIRREIGPAGEAHMTCFNATGLERTLAVRLGIPLYAPDPALVDLGSKSGSRETFRAAGVDLAPGFERLRDVGDMAGALTALRRDHPRLRRAVVKLEEGFSGEGNALFDFEGCPDDAGLHAWVKRRLPDGLKPEARTMAAEAFLEKYDGMGGIVEAFVEGAEKRSPSAQCRVDPLGNARVISTHDQELGGPSGQIFLGCTFPAADPYRLAIQEAGGRVARVLRDRGVIGRFGVDFVSVREPDRWRHYAIEINLRKGGTTHPFLMLEFLTDGAYDDATGLYHTPDGAPRYYYATDNLEQPAYRGLTPEDLIDIAVCRRLHFHGATQQGVVFHLIGALSEYGKLGAVCIGDSPARARALFEETVAVLNEEAAR